MRVRPFSMRRRIVAGALAVVATLASCARTPEPPPLTPGQLTDTAWDRVLEDARSTTVRFGMWAGDESRNRFFQGPVVAAVATQLGITLEVTPLVDVADVVNKLLNERRAGLDRGGSIDLVWINGENFRTAKQAQVLWGPFASALPNLRYYPGPARATDFGTPVDGFEVPWEVAQFVFAHDTARVPSPPTSLAALADWAASHPGRFTYPAIPDFTGSAFIRHALVHLSGEPASAFARFDEDRYARASVRALAYLRDLAPHLWRGGETYPATPAELNRLFVNGEVDFSMNYGPTFASERIARGEFPDTVRTFVLDEGTLSNYSYLAIPFNTPNPTGALAVVNHLLSPEHALARTAAIGGLFPHLLDTLPPEHRAAVAELPRGTATLPADVLASHRIPEPDAEYLVRFERDWRREVLQR